MTKIDVTQRIKDWDMKSDWATPSVTCGACGQTKEEAHLTLRSMCLQVLDGRSESGVEKGEKFERFNLAQEIYSNDEVDMDTEQRAMLQRLIMRDVASTLFACQAHVMLEGDAAEAAKG